MLPVRHEAKLVAPPKVICNAGLLGAAHEKIIYGFQMNEPIVVFFWEQRVVHLLVNLLDALFVPSLQNTMSSVSHSHTPTPTQNNCWKNYWPTSESSERHQI